MFERLIYRWVLPILFLIRCGGTEPATDSQSPPVVPPVDLPPVDPPVQDPPPDPVLPPVDPQDPDYGVLVSGTIVDFETGLDVQGSGTVSTAGLNPPPTVSVTGAAFSILHVPLSSVFQILAGSPPEYRSTFNEAITVESSALTEIRAKTLSESYLLRLAQSFQVTPRPGTGMIIARVVGEDGEPLAGVDRSVFTIDGASPPRPAYFLGPDLSPEPNLTRSSASGYVVFYDLSPGLSSVQSAQGSRIALSNVTAPTAAGVVTLTTIRAYAEVAPPVVRVSFAGDVLPILERRGCENCHSGNGIGRDLGDLTLDGSGNLIHRELTEEASPIAGILRVDLAEPSASLVLTLPLLETPPDRHPNVTFQNSSDPDYRTILQWITEGAPQD